MYPGGDGGAEDRTSADSPTGDRKPDDQMDRDEGETALLPKSILGGKEFQPGDEVVLKVVHIYEDEVEVAYAAEKKPGGEGAGLGSPGEGGSEMHQAEGRLSAMASK